MPVGHAAARVRRDKPSVPQGSPQKFLRAPQGGAHRPQEAGQPVEGQQDATTSPPASSARRTAPAVATAPGESPWTHNESTRGARPTRSRGDVLRVGDEGSRLLARHEPALGGVAAVGKPLEPDTATSLQRQVQQPGPRHPDHRQVAGPVQHGRGLLLVDRDPVVERTVRLQVDHLPTLCGGDGGQRTHLLGDLLRAGRRVARRARPGRSAPGRRRTPAHPPTPHAVRPRRRPPAWWRRLPAWNPHATLALVTTASRPTSSVTSSPRSALRSTRPVGARSACCQCHAEPLRSP